MTVSIQNLRFSYAPQRAPETLAIADWFIGKGDWVLVYGPSGSGKSTLLNLLAGVLVASQGAISVMGKSLSAMGGRQRDRFRATHIGVVFQQFNLFHTYRSWTISVWPPISAKRQRAHLINAPTAYCAHCKSTPRSKSVLQAN